MRGTVVSGLGRGRFFISLEGYSRQFAEKLGFIPFPGTLNIRLDEPFPEGRPVVIEGFSEGGRTFGGCRCYRIKLNGIDAAVIRPERSRYPEDLIEVIAQVNLREALGLRDGDAVEVAVLSAAELPQEALYSCTRRADWLYQQGRFDEAAECYDRALTQAQEGERLDQIWNRRGLALCRLGLLSEARASFDRALQINAECTDALNNIGVVLYRQKKFDEAVAIFDEIIGREPGYIRAWYNKGVVMDRLGRFRQAVEYYDQALKLNSSGGRIWSNRGVSLANLGDYEAALDSFDMSIALQPERSEFWNNRGAALGRLRRYSEALDNFERATDIDPLNADAWCNLGEALRRRGELERAVESYDRAITIDSGHAGAWNGKGLALKALGRVEEADAAFARGAQITNTEEAER